MLEPHQITGCPLILLFENLVWFVKSLFLTIIVIIAVTNICA
jgi:hypothetical protein